MKNGRSPLPHEEAVIFSYSGHFGSMSFRVIIIEGNIGKELARRAVLKLPTSSSKKSQESFLYASSSNR